jgi:hypothetical protein
MKRFDHAVHIILCSVQIPHMILKKQSNTTNIVFQSLNNFALYNEVFLKFCYSERPVIQVS